MTNDAVFFKKIISLIDLTSLNETDTDATIKTLCEKAVTHFGYVAAVCVYPKFVNQARQLLAKTPIKIATVVNFPVGNDSLPMILSTIEQSIRDGANEIDLVFPYQQYLAGDHESALEIIRQSKKICGETILLKVILETGAIPDLKILEQISEAVIVAGADFLKTSTGKIEIGATLESARVMLETIKKSDVNVGIKISGGVRTIEQAAQYIQLAEQIMGQDWVNKNRFRIGASQLVDVVIQALS